MNKTIEHVEREAGAKIPRDEVSLRDGGGGKKLSYLEAHYVIQRMNEVFGPMGWDQEVVEMRQVNKDDAKPSYIAKVRVSAIVKTEEGYMRCTKEDYGYGSDKSGLNPHEMASKEAVSDAFKRAARQFGMSLGLALYSKEQENVEDAPKPAAPAPKPAPTQTVAPTKLAVPGADEINKRSPEQYGDASREALNKRISAISKVVIAKRLKTLDELKADMKAKYGADNTAGLDDAEAKDLLANLEKMANGA